MIVLLQRGTAPGGIRYQGVEMRGSEGRDVPAGQVAGHIAHARMRRQRATTGSIPARHYHLATVFAVSTRMVASFRAGECDVRDATGEEGDAGAASALRGKGFAELIEKEMADRLAAADRSRGRQLRAVLKFRLSWRRPAGRSAGRSAEASRPSRCARDKAANGDTRNSSPPAKKMGV